MSKIHDLYKSSRIKRDMQPFLEHIATLSAEAVNETDGNQQTVLCYALIDDDVEVTGALLRKGANTASAILQSPLFLATFSNKPEVLIPLLLKFSANINEANALGKSLLQWAARKNDEHALKRMRLLLENGINVHHADDGGSTFLIDAMGIEGITQPHEGKVQLALEYGAGIAADFNLLPTPSSRLLDGAVLIGASKGGKRLTRETPGFERAIFTVKEFIQAIADEYSFNYVGLHNTVSRLIQNGNKDQELIDFEAYLKPLALSAKEAAASRAERFAASSHLTATAAFHQSAAARASSPPRSSGSSADHAIPNNGKPPVK